MRNDCNRKCNGLSSVKWQKTFISLRNPCGYIRHSRLIRSVRCVYRNVRFYAFCAYRQAAVCFFVYFSLYGYDENFGRWKNVMRLYGLRNVNVMGLIVDKEVRVKREREGEVTLLSVLLKLKWFFKEH